jgi:SAM-dependent methyltransferase
MKKIYLAELEALKHLSDNIPDTPMIAFAKIIALVVLNMRYEKIMLDRNLKSHPYILVNDIVKESQSFLTTMQQISFIEAPCAPCFSPNEKSMEDGHEELFQKLWIDFSEQEYKSRIERYVYRLKINGLADGWLKGFKCIDFGCGHGNFAHALIRAGADFVYGVDVGKDSIEYAIKARDTLMVKPEQIEFKIESVYNVSCECNSFDFAIQNGVFHHLEDEDAAYKKVLDVLKPGGWLWIYTDGEGSIAGDLWDVSRHILKAVPYEFVISCLKFMNIETGKRYHLGDGLNAIYRRTTWKDLTGRLRKLGFGNFRRLVGGYATDFDHDVIAADKYGKEKFGEGDLRILCQLI